MENSPKAEKKLPLWLRLFNLGFFIATLFAGTIIFFVIKLWYYQTYENRSWGEAKAIVGKEFVEHMDFWGYLIGIAGIFLSGYIVRKIEEKNDQKNDELTEQIEKLKELDNQISKTVANLDETTKAIQNSNNEITNNTKKIEDKTQELAEQTERAIDASRRIIDRIPDIFRNIEDILEKANQPKCEKFYYMNGPIAFGKLHAYNMRVVNEFEKTSDYKKYIGDYSNLIMDNKNVSEKLKLFMCNRSAVKIRNALKKISERAKRDKLDFKMIVSDEAQLETFVKKYLINESEKNFDSDGLMYFRMSSQDDNSDVSNRADSNFTNTIIDITKSDGENEAQIREDIQKTFLEFNRQTLEACKDNAPANSIKYSKEDPQYQLYLADCDDEKYSLLIFYHDEYVMQRGNKSLQRRLVGFSSDNRHIFKGLEDIYVDRFNNAN